MTLTLKNARKTYPDGTQALLPTDLHVNTGEIISLLGPSGCGKTTLLRIIAGLESPDAGTEVFFDSDDVTRMPVEQRNVGMVFQSYALFPNMSVRENIGYGLKMQKLSSQQISERVDEVIQLCQLNTQADRTITALSGGQRQRVALARAMAPRPRILLLDEPLSALDASLRDNLRDELALLLRKFEITAIFVTHDQNEALAIADRVAVMSAGQVAQIGTPEELYRQPISEFVAGFVGNAMKLGGEGSTAGIKLPGGLLPVNQDCTGKSAFVRAEDINIDANGSLTGKVASVTYLGTHYRVGIEGLADQAIFAFYSGLEVPKIGQNVSVSIAADAVLLF